MSVYEFIKQYGLDLAHRDIACLESGFITEQDFIEANGFEFKELRRVVESHELVERLGGLNEAAAKFIKYQHQEPCFQEYLKCSSRRLEQAIADVEACQ